MSTLWNPAAPETLGLEWFPARGRSRTVSASGSGAAMVVPSRWDETIASVELYLPVVTVPGRYMLDVYEAGDEVGDNAEASFSWAPTKDGPMSGSWAGSHEQSPELYRNVNDANAGDQWGWSRVEGTGEWIVFHLDGETLTGKRALEVTPKFVSNGGTEVQALIRDLAALTNHPWGDALPRTSAPQVYYRSTGEINPVSGDPWTAADLAKLFTGTEGYGLGLLADQTAQQVQLQRMWVTGRLAEERRVALATASVTGAGWVSFPLTTPAGAAGWAKAAGKSYTFVLRRSGDVGAAAWAYLEGRSPIDADAHAPNLTGGGLVTAMGDKQSRTYALGMTRSDAAPSADSQPYAVLGAVTVSEGFPASQGITGGDGSVYGRVQALVANPGGETQTLAVSVHQVSDGAQRGGTVTVDADELADFDAVGDWRLLDVTLPSSATLEPDVDYYVRFACDGPTGWQVAALDTAAAPAAAVAHDAGAHPTTYEGATHTGVDLLVTVATVPPPPAAFRLSTGQQDVLNPGCAPDGVAVESIAFTRMDWEATEMGSAFGYYEVQRHEAGPGWLTIARITDETVEVFEDYEARREAATSYRVRTVRADRSSSDWVEAGPVALSTTGDQLLFVTNEAPHLNLGYQDLGPERAYDFQDPPDRLVPLFGQDYQVAFRDLSRRGDAFDVTLVLNATDEPDNPGRAVFDKLLTITRAALSYVCVLDADGSRWFASVHVSQGRRRVRFYAADVRVVEVTDRPAVVDRTVS